MKKSILSCLALIFTTLSFAQESISSLEQNLSIDKFTDGTLVLPENAENPPLVIFIQGSGPVNRDGNAPMMKNDGMKKISKELASNGIASFRYDKRIFKMDKFRMKEEDLTFNDFVLDLSNVIQYFQKENNFSKIIIAGHSEGSLIGILGAQGETADGYISLAGAGRKIDDIIVDQLLKQSAELSENARIAFDEMKTNGRTQNYSSYLESIFRPSVQPFISSWMKYDPAEEISKLKIPVLILIGSNDLQVDVRDAEILKEANPAAKLVILEDMNHIFRKIEGENLDNTKAYNEPARPLHPELIPTMVEFVNSIK